jgi:hypothetical protein
MPATCQHITTLSQESCCVVQSYDAGEYDKLVAKYEKLNWRMISKPGGATVKPDDFYSLYGCEMQQTPFMSMSVSISMSI